MATGKLTFCDSVLAGGVSCFLDQGHHDLAGVASGAFVGVAFGTSSSCAVTFFSGSEYGLPLESVSWTRMCVGWLTVRPGPLT